MNGIACYDDGMHISKANAQKCSSSAINSADNFSNAVFYISNFAGLWTVCFQNFTDIHRFYDVQFKGCMWVFEEEYYIIHDFLLPGFYIAVQFFFTLTFTLLLVSALLTFGLFMYSRDDDRYMVVLLSNGASQVAGCEYCANIRRSRTNY